MTEEGDPVFSCIFKTELAATLLTLSQGSISLLIGPTYAHYFQSSLTRRLNDFKGWNTRKRKIRKCRSNLLRMKASPKVVSTKATQFRSRLANLPAVCRARPPNGSPALCVQLHKANFFDLAVLLMHVYFQVLSTQSSKNLHICRRQLRHPAPNQLRGHYQARVRRSPSHGLWLRQPRPNGHRLHLRGMSPHLRHRRSRKFRCIAPSTLSKDKREK